MAGAIPSAQWSSQQEQCDNGGKGALEFHFFFSCGQALCCLHSWANQPKRAGAGVVVAFELTGEIGLLAEACAGSDLFDELASGQKRTGFLQAVQGHPGVGGTAKFRPEIATELAVGHAALSGQARNSKTHLLGPGFPVGDVIESAAHLRGVKGWNG